MNKALINFYARRIYKGSMEMKDIDKAYHNEVYKAINELKVKDAGNSNSDETTEK
jgi:hypothetical protein